MKYVHCAASILEHEKNVKLRQNLFHIKDIGKSSSRKLRRVIYYTLYRMDPQKKHYKNMFSSNKKVGKKTYTRKLRYVNYYTLYRMDPQKTHL